MKFNKKRCEKCKYCGGQRNPQNIVHTLYCNYAGIEGRTCLYTDKGQVKDKRGDDYNQCALFTPAQTIQVG